MTSRMSRIHPAAVWLGLVAIWAGGPPATARPVDSAPPAPGRAEAPPEAVATVQEARALQDAQRWDEAAEAWAAITRADDTNGMAWHYLGYCLHEAGRLDQAIEADKKASTFADYKAISLYNLGCAYALSNRPDEAIEALAAAQAAGWRLRDYVGRDSDLDSLLDDPRLQELVAREPVGFQETIQLVLARAQEVMKQHAPQLKQAWAAFVQQAAREAQLALGELEQELAKDERTAPYAEKLRHLLGSAGPGAAGADASLPPEVQAMIAEAVQLQQAGQWPEAAAAWKAVLERRPDNPQLCFAYAYALHMAGDYEKAIEADRKAASFDQTRGIALYNLACACALTGRADEALAALEGSREAGFDISAARTDSDLESLRADPRFQALLEGN
jgi:tetratricopeptide (TPR) repeat protein